MAAKDRLPEAPRALLEPLERHPDWARLMNKDVAALVIEGKADAREAADFVFARIVRKAA